MLVLNLIITGIPSIPVQEIFEHGTLMAVLNLIITGIPSIPWLECYKSRFWIGFKPYYNWNTFNTLKDIGQFLENVVVLNLIITGIPSIL